MLTLSGLVDIQTKPKLNEMSLKLIADYYESYLMDKVFSYRLENNKNIELHFKKDHLCHLIAIHKFSPERKLDHLYHGFKGFDRLIAEEITFESLKSIDKKKFKDYRERMQFFPFTYRLLKTCDSVYFDKNNVSGNGSCRIDAKMLLYAEFDKKILHLGIDLENSGDKYFPRSFFLAREKQKDKYIKNQISVKILDITISKSGGQ